MPRMRKTSAGQKIATIDNIFLFLASGVVNTYIHCIVMGLPISTSVYILHSWCNRQTSNISAWQILHFQGSYGSECMYAPSSRFDAETLANRYKKLMTTSGCVAIHLIGKIVTRMGTQMLNMYVPSFILLSSAW